MSEQVEKIIQKMVNGLDGPLPPLSSVSGGPTLPSISLDTSATAEAAQLASGAMIQTAQAHEAVLSEMEAHDHFLRIARETLAAKRQEADRINRELIDLCAEMKEHTAAGYEILKRMGSKLIESAKG